MKRGSRTENTALVELVRKLGPTITLPNAVAAVARASAVEKLAARPVDAVGTVLQRAAGENA